MSPLHIILLTVYCTGLAFCYCMLWVSRSEPDDRVTAFDWITATLWPLALTFSILTFIHAEFRTMSNKTRYWTYAALGLFCLIAVLAYGYQDIWWMILIFAALLGGYELWLYHDLKKR